MQESLKKWIIFLLFVVVIFGVSFYYRFELSIILGKFLILDKQTQKADVIFVPGGHPYYRLPYALKLFNEGYGNQMWCTATAVSNTEKEFEKIFGFVANEEFIIKEVFKRIKFSNDKYKILCGSESTFKDVILLHKEIENKPVSSVLIVSDAYHTKRIDFCIKKIFKKNKDIKFYYTYEETEKLITNLLEKDDLPLIILQEYIKYIAYQIKYLNF
ncbi:MAG: ElyC/SanA/YdcF family protein [Candidatus Hydrogenedentota bacterium]